MKINHRHYILIIFAIISIIVSIFCYFFLYRQTTTQANNYLDSIKQVESEKNTVNYEQKLIDTFNKYEQDRLKIESYVVKEDKLVDFIERIEKIGSDSKTDLQLSSITSVDNKIKARVNTTGGWQGVMTALQMIENIPLSVSISNVRLDTSGDIEGIVNSKTTKIREWRLSIDIETLTTK